jgi:hypothetical protein
MELAVFSCQLDDRKDGVLDCMDCCGGLNDANYVGNASCGVGYCRTNNTPSSCVGGSETLCQPGAPRVASGEARGRDVGA